MRVVSLIASATEIVCALGRRDWLVARSHECDWPADVLALPRLTEAKFSVEGSSADIDARVQQIVREGLSVYRVDGEALQALAPDVIITQDHCDVCAVSLADVEAATCTWTGRPVRIVSLRPDSLADTYADIRRVAAALQIEAGGEALVGAMQSRFAAIQARVAGRPRPSVAFVEWVEPMMAGGNWMPELVEIAGGKNLFGQAGVRSDWMRYEDLQAADPDVIVVAPCGYDLQRCLQELDVLRAKPGWRDLRAVRTERVCFADGNAYFNRPGPRLADSAEMLFEMLHPGLAGSDPKHAGKTWVYAA